MKALPPVDPTLVEALARLSAAGRSRDAADEDAAQPLADAVRLRDAVVAAAEALRAGADPGGAEAAALELLPGLLRALRPGPLAALLGQDCRVVVAAAARRALRLRRPVHHGAVLADALAPLAPLCPDLLFIDLLDASPRPIEGADQLPHRLKNALLGQDEASGPWAELRLRLLTDLPRDRAQLDRAQPRAKAGELDAIHTLLDAAFAEQPPAEAAAVALLWAERASAGADRDQVLARAWRMACRARRPALAVAIAARALGAAPQLAWVLRAGASALPEHGGPGLPLPADHPLAADLDHCQAALDGSTAPDAPALQVVMELLRGDLEMVVARLTAADPLDVLQPGHPAPLSLPPLLVLASGGSPGIRCQTLLRRMDEQTRGRPRRRPEGPAEPPRHERLWIAVARGEAAQVSAPWLRLVLRAEVLRALDAAAKAKQGYEVVTAWVRAVSELIAGTDGQRAADRFLDEAMRRHPRHKALIRMLHVDLVAPDDGEEAEG